MVDRLKRRWRTDRSENFDEYMKATDVSFPLRQIALKLTIYEEISQNGDLWTINKTSTFKNHKMVFKLGESFIDNTPDGKTMKTTFSVDGNKLVARQEKVVDNEIPATFTREVTNNGDMLISTKAENGAWCKRWYVPDDS